MKIQRNSCNIIYSEKEAINKQAKYVLAVDSDLVNFIISYIEPLNDEDREQLIIEEVDARCMDFHEDKYIVRHELIEKINDSEKVIIYFLNIEELEQRYGRDIFKNYKIIAILPSFFIARYNKQYTDFVAIDISDSYFYVSTYKNKKLVKLEKFAMFDTSFECLEFLTDNYVGENIVISGQSEMKSELLARIFETGELASNILDFQLKEINYKDKINFLPKIYYSKLQRLKEDYFIHICILIIIFFTLVAKLFLMHLSSNYEKELAELEHQNSIVAKEINEIKFENEELKSQLKLRNTSINKTTKLSLLMEELYNFIPAGVFINKITYLEEEGSLKLEGSALDIKDTRYIINSFKNSQYFDVKDFTSIEKKENENYNFILVLNLKKIGDANENWF